MIKKYSLLLWMFFLSLFSVWAYAEASDEDATKPYRLVKQQLSLGGDGKVHIQEFFWYSCPHCYSLQASTTDWYQSIPHNNVELELVPPAINVYWKTMSELYYTLKEMHVISRMHMKIFDALQKSETNLYDPKTLKTFLASNGIDWANYQSTKNSFAVQTLVQRSANLANSYGIEGVPVFVVQGKYMTSMVLTGGETQLFITLNNLIKKVKQEEHIQ